MRLCHTLFGVWLMLNLAAMNTDYKPIANQLHKTLDCWEAFLYTNRDVALSHQKLMYVANGNRKKEKLSFYWPHFIWANDVTCLSCMFWSKMCFEKWPYQSRTQSSARILAGHMFWCCSCSAESIESEHHFSPVFCYAGTQMLHRTMYNEWYWI